MRKIKLGTRSSPLAIAQSKIVCEKLAALHPDLAAGRVEIEICPMRTLGDWQPAQRESSFLEMGQSKGLFTKEIEEALLEGAIDFAVHSMKDVSVWTPRGLAFPAITLREDPRDAFVSLSFPSLDALPKGARVGTASLRRKAQLLMRRPDLDVVPLRGNVETRLRKLEAGEAAATLLAFAGLKRLGLEARASSVLSPDEMLPSAAQGVLGLECRADDTETRAFLLPLHDPVTAAAASAERAVLRVLDGSCRTPIAALARSKGEALHLVALAAKPDGSFFVREEDLGTLDRADALGCTVGQRMKDKLPDDFLL